MKEKNVILDQLDKGVKKKDFAFKVDIPLNSLSTIIKKRDKLKKYDSSDF